MSVDFLARLVGMVVFGFVGWQLGYSLAQADATPDYLRWVLSLSLSGAALGILLTPAITTQPFRWFRREIREMEVTDLVAGTVGLVIGLLVSALLTMPLVQLPGTIAGFLPIVAVIIFGYLGAAIMVMRQREIFSLFGLGGAFAIGGRGRGYDRLLLDTSAIIDGRIADVSQTGFIQGTVVIPAFVLSELQKIADSADPLKRGRGRRGLEMLQKLQKDSDLPIHISDIDFDDVHEVDAKLVRLAKKLKGAIVTTDYNLNRVAQIQGVRVLNLNDVANAVRPVVLPGEDMVVRIVREGTGANQGVGYLDDGTMVVVDGGLRYLQSEVGIAVTRVTQTAAGRMIFAQPKPESVATHE